MADQTIKEHKELENEIRELTRDIYEQEKWLIKKIGEEIPVEGLLFLEVTDGSADDINTCCGSFVTPDKQIYGFSYEEGFDHDTDEEIDKFFLEKYETPELIPIELKENPLLKIVLPMNPI